MSALTGLVLLAVYVVIVLAVASGWREWAGFVTYLVVFIPLWLAQWAESAGGPLGIRPERPSHTMAFAGVAQALGPAGLLAWMFFSVPHEDSSLLSFAVFLILMGSMFVPRAANWIRVWNEEQTQRLVAAEHDLAIARTRVLQSQMQPHFLFNALNSVTALMRDDPSRAKAVLRSLKGLMERSLTTAQQTTSTVREEVAFVRDQLAIEQERFHDRLTVRFDIDAALLDVPIPPFSLQPLVENALRHGIARSIDGGDVVVRVSKEEQNLVLTVENTGAGLAPRWQEGLGLGNLRQRLQSDYGPRATVTVEQHGHRTIATIRMPLHVR